MDTAHTFHAIFLRHHDVREQLGLVEGCSRRVPLEGLQDLVVLEVVLNHVVDGRGLERSNIMMTKRPW